MTKIKFFTQYNKVITSKDLEHSDPISKTEPDMTIDIKELYRRAVSGQYIPEGASYDNGAKYDAESPEMAERLDTRLRSAIDVSEATQIAEEQQQAIATKHQESAQASRPDTSKGDVSSPGTEGSVAQEPEA